MDILIKLFKTLNSAQKPWQITLAVVLGMLMGLTPLSGIQTLLILFLAFVVNIHLGFFFIMAAQFAAIGYVLDPFFESFGFYLLSLESLQTLWTTMYNSGLMRLTYFNNTIVLGSSVISLLLALPLYFLISKVLFVYRDRIAVYCAQHKWLNKFGFFNRPDKKEPAMRLWGLGAFLVIAVSLTIVVIFFLDAWMKKGLEKSLEFVFSKPVHIERLETSWSEATLDIETLHIGSSKPQYAALSIETIHSDLDFNALLLGKVNIEKVMVNGMKFNQKSEYLKKVSLEDVKQKEAKDAQSSKEGNEESPKDTPSFMQLPSVDEVMANSGLKSQKSYDAAQAEIDTITQKWQNKEKTFSKDLALHEIEDDFKVLSSMAQKIDLKNIKTFKSKTDAFKAKIKEKKSRLQTLKSDFAKDKNRMDSLIKSVKKSKDSDFAAIKSNYTLDAKGGINVLGSFLGPKIQNNLYTALDLYKKITPYIQSEDEQHKNAVDRHKGRTVRFKELKPQADLHIMKVEINGDYEGQSFQATIDDISDNQKLLNKAIVFKLVSDGKKAKDLLLTGYDDRRGTTVKDYINLNIKSVPKTAFDLSLITLEDSDMSVKGDLTIIKQKDLAGKIKMDFAKAALTSKDLKGRLGKALRADLVNVKRFYAFITIGGDFSKPDLKVRSDLSDYLKNSVNRYAKNQLKAFESRIASRLDEMTQNRLKTLGTKQQSFFDVGGKLTDFDNKLDVMNTQSTSLDASPKKKLKNLLGF